MTTLPMEEYFSKILEKTNEKIPEEILGYFRARLQDQFHEIVLDEFMKRKEEDSNFSRAFLARRLGKKPEQITRWLGSPGNWTSDTFSDLLIAISGAIPNVTIKHFDELPQRNYSGPAWCMNIETAACLPSCELSPETEAPIPTIDVTSGPSIVITVDESNWSISPTDLVNDGERVTS